jgi:hypothetical protein
MEIHQLLQRIINTQPEEISCSECFDMIAVYVDQELANVPVDQLLPQFKQHIHQCAVCRQEYELVRELAAAEQAGAPPAIDDLKKSFEADPPSQG